MIHSNLFHVTASWRTIVVLSASIILIGAFGVFLFATHNAQADEPSIFSDGFESGDFSAWTSVGEESEGGSGWLVNSSSAHSGTKKARVKGNTNGDVVLRADVSTEGHEDITLTYWYNITSSNALEEGDHVYVEWWDDDEEEWVELADYTDMSTEGWTEAEHELPSEANNNSDFAFRFRANLGSGSDEFRLDDVELTGSSSVTLGSIHAFKFHDVNGDGWYEEEDGDAPLEGWWICLEGDDFEDCQQTDADGWVWWMDLEPQDYYLYEEEQDSWFYTRTDYYELNFYDDDGGYFYVEDEWDEDDYSLEEFEEGLEFHFGNTQYAIHALKYWDKDGNGWRDDEWYEAWSDTWHLGDEPVIEGWTMCLLEESTYYDVEDWWYDLEEDEEFFEQFDNYTDVDFIQYLLGEGFIDEDEANCQETDANGLVWWMGLEEDDYVVIEERRNGWVLTTEEDWYDSYEMENGIAWVYLGEESDDYVVEIEFGNARRDIHAHKFFDVNQDGYWSWLDEDVREPGIIDWEICLWGDDDFYDCQLTDASGWVHWLGVEPGEYILEEENRDGWLQTLPSHYEEEGGPGYYYVWVDDDEGEVEYWDSYSEDNWDVARFGNWTFDTSVPESRFDDSMNHRIIDTEIVALNLSGTSTDPQSLVQSATMTIRRLGDAELGGAFIIDSFFDVYYDISPSGGSDFVVDSFFDVFYEIDCSDPELRTFDTEILSMDLTSVDPITVSWSHEVELAPGGIYCFEVSATNNAGTVERTAYAGPVAYLTTTPPTSSGGGAVTPLLISGEQVTGMDAATGEATVEWLTNLFSSSQVIYGLLSGGPYNFNMAGDGFFGYPLGTDEAGAGVTEHSVGLSGLIPGEEYVYRVASGSAFLVVGEEQSFTFPMLDEEEPSDEENPGSQGAVLGEVLYPLYRILEDIKVYAIANNLKRHIPTPEAFEANGFMWEDVVSLAPEDEPQNEEATLLRAIGDVKVFLIDMVNLTKSWIETEEDFNAGGYNWGDVIDVPQVELDAYSEI